MKVYEITLDYETKSECDLLLKGTVNYAQHPTTTLLSCYATLNKIKFKNGNKVAKKIKSLLFIPDNNNEEFIEFLNDAFYYYDATLHAHNWSFEYWVSKEVGIKKFDFPKCMANPLNYHCTMAKSLANGLPAGLATVNQFLGIKEKDKDGHRVMLQCTKPRRARKDEDASLTHWFDDQERLQKVYDYNKIDVEAEIELDLHLKEISNTDMPVFRLDQKINLTGVRVDMDLINGAIKIIQANEKYNYECLPSDYADYFETLGQHVKVKKYLNEACLYFPENLQKDYLIDQYNNHLDTIPKKAREVIRARLELGSAAVKKYITFKHQAVEDDCGDFFVYHTLQYCGAAGSGRWAGRGVQLHNMPRGVAPYETLSKGRKLVKAGKFKKVKKLCNKHGVAVTELLAALCRSILIPRDGKAFVVNDYTSVEARGVMLLSGCQAGLDMFNNASEGQGPYEHMASIIFKKETLDITKPERFVGKQAILGAGYGMGAPRFGTQCADYGQPIDASLAKKTINAYRKQFPEIVDLWYDLEDVFRACFKSKRLNKLYRVNKYLQFEYAGDRNVLMWLPSGRYIKYNKCAIDEEDAITYHKFKDGRMFKNHIWGGHFLENACQALCRDILAWAMLELDKNNHTILLTVHDELINEVQARTCDRAFKSIQKTLLKPPEWAEDFPMGIDGAILQHHYKKI
ncbi:MAG: hypothetical protein GY941_19755 [Planctomycetes bacterium]|nr:hypothetical protein [Planctomycetota bacterium]